MGTTVCDMVHPLILTLSSAYSHCIVGPELAIMRTLAM
jgi:hypothetical protein